MTNVVFPATRGFASMKATVYVQSLGMPVLRIVVLGVLVLFGFGVISVAYAWAVPMAGSVLVGMAMLRGLHNKVVDSAPSRSSVGGGQHPVTREFWRFSLPRCIASTCSSTITWFDIILVSSIVSTRVAGIYGIASRYVMIASYATGAFSLAISPQISGLFSARRFRDASRLYQSATTWLIMVSWPVCFLMAVFALPLMRLFGHGFTGGATALTILSGGMLIASGAGNNTPVLLMSGHSVLNLLISGVAVATNVGLNLLLVPRFGINGAAIAWVATFLVMNTSTSVALLALMWMHPFTTSYAWVAGLSLVCFGGVGWATRELLGSSFLGLVVATTIGLCIYSSVIWRLRNRLNIDAFARRRRAREIPELHFEGRAEAEYG
jgi:O-antigen/teichoic acid export membrane protein